MQTPPSVLITPCDIPQTPALKTNNDLLLYTLDLEYKLRICAGKVDAISQYYTLLQETKHE